jgi:hypothetical protein
MQFPPNPTTEIIVPSGVPFEPGNDVIGIGTLLPPELAAYTPIPGGGTVKAAIVFYSSAYNPAGTTPQVKFFWMGIGSDAGVGSTLNIGVGIVNNASVSQVAVINSGFSVAPFIGFPGSGHITMEYVAVNHLDNTIFGIGEFNTGGDGGLTVQTNAGGNAGPVSGSVING